MDSYQKLLDQSVNENWRSNDTALRQLALSPEGDAAFAYLIGQLEHEDDRIRFAALDVMVWNFALQLQQADDSVLEKLLTCWRDPCSPVIDRAMWALHIKGPEGIDFVLTRLNDQPNFPLDLTLFWLARHPDKRQRTEAIMAAFDEFLVHTELATRVDAALSLLEMTPVRAPLRQLMPDFDFRPYYPQLLSILEEGDNAGIWKGNFIKTHIRWLQSHMDF